MSERLREAAIGTKAPAFGGGGWVKNEHGWKWNGPNGNGGVYPRPGGDWTGDLVAPVSDPTPPAVSDAMREAVARLPEATYDDLARACRQTELDNRRLTSEIARLTGERDAANATCDMAAMSGGFHAMHARNALARAEAAEAETARLRAALEDAADALGWAASALREDENDAAAGVTLSAANNARAAITSQEQADV